MLDIGKAVFIKPIDILVLYIIIFTLWKVIRLATTLK